MVYRDAWRLTAVIGAAIVAGLITGDLLACLLIAISAYLVWLHRQQRKLLHWIRDRKRSEPPDAPRVFEDLALEIDHLHERQKKRKKKLANYLKQFQQATRALPDATVLIGNHDEVHWANGAAKRDLGIRWPEDANQRVTNIVRLPALRAFLEARDHSSTIEIASPTAPGRHLSVLLAPYGKDQWLLVARDVTQLHRANQVRSDFVANVSHELRTPITVFRGYLENLERQRELCPPTWLAALDQLSLQADRMQTLIEELLLLSNLEQEEHVRNPEAVRVGEMIGDIHARARELSGEREHLFVLEADPGLVVLGASRELYSAFSNIVFNAVFYTPPRGVIRIRWYRNEDGAHLLVEDNGIGIAPEHLERLTERFYRIDASRSRTAGGTGLGLAIVKHVLARHGASLHISSTIGEGSRFRCDFPAQKIIEQPQEVETA